MSTTRHGFTLTALALLSPACSTYRELTAAQIDRVGLQIYDDVVARSVVITDGAQFDLVERVGRDIVRAADTAMPWEVKLLDGDGTANSFSLPGGRIGIYTGLLAVTENEAGLAIVLGHEAAHAVLRHGGKRMMEGAQWNDALAACRAGLGLAEMTIVARQGVMSAFGVSMQSAESVPFAANDEAEADVLGLRFAIRAGYDPWEAPKLWERMALFDQARAPEWARSHPAAKTRGDTLRALIPQLIEQERGWKPR